MKSVHKFYNSIGWKKNDKYFKDASISEDLRFYSREYVSKCRKRILRYIPKKGVNILDFASGPIQYKEYLIKPLDNCSVTPANFELFSY